MEEEKMEKREAGEIASGCCNKKKAGSFFIIGALLLVVGVSYGYSYWKKNYSVETKGAEVKTKIEKFIVEKLVPAGTKVEIADFAWEKGLYKMTVKVGEKEIPAYATKDGTKFFPQVMDTENYKDDSAEESDEAREVSNKTDKPEVELYVMSYCPYGIQMEKGIVPAVKALGDKINFKLKFVDYILHGEKEAKENLNQYCVQKEEPQKLVSYLECFNKAGKTDECLRTVKINSAKNKACTVAADKEFRITESLKGGAKTPAFGIDADDNNKYGVQGSPTLVINGTKLSAKRDSDSLLKLICTAFNNAPEECNQQLPSAGPTAGFDSAGSASQAAGDCATQ